MIGLKIFPKFFVDTGGGRKKEKISCVFNLRVYKTGVVDGIAITTQRLQATPVLRENWCRYKEEIEISLENQEVQATPVFEDKLVSWEENWCRNSTFLFFPLLFLPLFLSLHNPNFWFTSFLCVTLCNTTQLNSTKHDKLRQSPSVPNEGLDCGRFSFPNLSVSQLLSFSEGGKSFL